MRKTSKIALFIIILALLATWLNITSPATDHIDLLLFWAVVCGAIAVVIIKNPY